VKADDAEDDDADEPEEQSVWSSIVISYYDKRDQVIDWK
jgi:hypothetical protein